MSRTRVLISLLALASASAPSFVAAQQAQYGPPLAGVCVFGRAQAIGGSKAGQAGTARMQQIAAGVTAELNPQRQAIVTEGNALQAGQKTMPAAELQQRGAALRQRAQAFDVLQRTRAAQLQQTRVLAEQQISRTMDPIVAQIITTHRCSVVLDRGALYGANPASDITPEVVRALDTQLPTVQFNLAPPPAPAPAAR